MLQSFYVKSMKESSPILDFEVKVTFSLKKGAKLVLERDILYLLIEKLFIEKVC